jgi:hypothetical protein
MKCDMNDERVIFYTYRTISKINECKLLRRTLVNGMCGLELVMVMTEGRMRKNDRKIQDS